MGEKIAKKPDHDGQYYVILSIMAAMTGLSEVVSSQKRELEEQLSRPYVERAVAPESVAPTDLIRVVVGPRRAGKSTLAIQLLKRLGGGGYVNFDDERLSDLADADLLLAAVDEVYGRPTNLLFDEIQNFPSWELLANRLQRAGRRLLLTGSNAHLLAGELATHLTGRYQQIVLLPFSFAETLASRNEGTAGAHLSPAFERYLREGGYPEPLLRGANRGEYLRDLVRATLHKDVVRRHHIRTAAGLEDALHFLMSNDAKEFSYRTLAAIARVTSPTTAEKHVRLLAEAFLLFTVNRFSFKARERATANKKAYAIDPSLAVHLGTRPGLDLGRLAENVVAIALWRQQLSGELELAFWKNREHEEVDFVVRRAGRISQLIQVCWDLTEPATRSRELRALVKAGEELRCTELWCLANVAEGTETFEWGHQRAAIRMMPIERWLADR